MKERNNTLTKSKKILIYDFPNEVEFKIRKTAALVGLNRSEMIVEVLENVIEDTYEKQFEEKESRLRAAYNSVFEAAGKDAAEKFRESTGLKKLDEIITKELENEKVVKQAEEILESEKEKAA